MFANINPLQCILREHFGILIKVGQLVYALYI